MPATPAWPPKSTPRLFVPPPLNINASVHLTGNAAHYLTHVMRRTVGDPVRLCDDVGGEYLAELTTVGKRDCILLVRGFLRERQLVDDFWLCASPIKRQRWDWLIEKATELGVGQICPIGMERSIAERINMERARAIAQEAAEQCGRTALPRIDTLQKLQHMLANWPAERRLYFADENGGENLLDVVQADGHVPAAVLIGPEGGFSDSERAAIRALPAARRVTLGPQILRAETAALAASTLILAARQSTSCAP
ncbi:MAG: 16S rRNA (uracil(1498)-N(3))-methyltransferase [Sphingomonadaceae bacterium]|nr:16S rRNA (uracil(1498)-N(3))-methyltransferase [Sphingomonadaceae bacterium]